MCLKQVRVPSVVDHNDHENVWETWYMRVEGYDAEQSY